MCQKWSYTLLKKDVLKDKTAPRSHEDRNSFESPLLNLPPEIRLEIWRLLAPHNENPRVICRGRLPRRGGQALRELCSRWNELDLLKINHQIRSEMLPLFAMRHAAFQFCTEVCAKRLMDEIACYEELGVSKAVIELIHIFGLGGSWCGTGRYRVRKRVIEGGSDPNFAFQVTFT